MPEIAKIHPAGLLAPTELLAAQETAQDLAAAALAVGTRDAYRRAWRIFAGWCAAQGLGACPALPGTVATWIGAAALAGRSPSRIAVVLGAVRAAHMAVGQSDPAAHPQVRMVMAGLRREKGGRCKSKTALVATDRGDGPSLLARVVDAIETDTLIGLRDRAILLLGFAAALRRSEIAGLTMADVEPTGRGLLLTIRAGKGDRARRGETVAAPRGRARCPVAAVETWTAAAGITAGPVFVRCDSGRIGDRPLDGGSIARLVRRRVAAVGLDATQFGAHSLRSGFLTSAAEAGASLWKMKEVSRHKSTAALERYIQRRTLFDQHAGDGLL
jgi:integrase